MEESKIWLDISRNNATTALVTAMILELPTAVATIAPLPDAVTASRIPPNNATTDATIPTQPELAGQTVASQLAAMESWTPGSNAMITTFGTEMVALASAEMNAETDN